MFRWWGDIIVAINGEPIEDMDDLIAYLITFGLSLWAAST